MADHHPDDEFHPPDRSDPYWTETCWFTFTVPERRLSGQFYPFFRHHPGGSARPGPSSGTTPATPRPTSSTPGTSGTSPSPSSRSPTSGCPTASPTGVSSRSDATSSPTVTPTPVRRPPGRRSRRHGRRAGRPDLHRHRPTQLPRRLPPRPARPLPGHHRPRRRGDPGGLLRVPRPFVGTAIPVRPRASTAPRPAAGATATPRPRTATPSTPSPWTSAGHRHGSMAIHGYLLRDGEWSKVASGSTDGARARPGTAYPTAVAVDLVDELGPTGCTPRAAA